VSRFQGSYAGDWKVIADEVKSSARWTCIRCEHAHDPAAGYCLTVHHLDGDKANNRWWNLLALCQRCHLVIQANVIPDRPFLFEHTAWFKPYVAGFYAHYYGGFDISRETAEANMDHFLAMGQPHLYGGAA
jgi:hypothetical protein